MPSVHYLDLVKEHRSYCPWANVKSQSGGKDGAMSGGAELAGWQVLLKVLQNDYILRIRSVPGEAQLSRVDDAPATDRDKCGGSAVGSDEKSIRDAKDKERWARLRRVKGLFETKASKKSKISSATIAGEGA